MNFDQRLRDALAVASQVNDWKEPYFTWGKSYVASVFSLVAYGHIPEYEVRNAKRARLIPCEKYQEVFSSNSFDSARQFIQNRGENKANFTIIERDMVVVVLAKTQNAFFISLRGTQGFHDVIADIDIRKVRIPPDKRSLIQLHRGFFEAVASCIQEVVDRTADQLDNGTPLYITGHSLGGAMAAIMNAQLKDVYNFRRWHPVNRHRKLIPTSCYTFGMPRYGNHYAVSQLSSPYHVYNEHDLVPTMPPRISKFADSSNEYCLTDTGKLMRPHKKSGGAFFRLRAGKLRIFAGREHKIERYVDRTKSAHISGVS